MADPTYASAAQVRRATGGLSHALRAKATTLDRSHHRFDDATLLSPKPRTVGSYQSLANRCVRWLKQQGRKVEVRLDWDGVGYDCVQEAVGSQAQTLAAGREGGGQHPRPTGGPQLPPRRDGGVASTKVCACCATVHAMDDGSGANSNCFICKRIPICDACSWNLTVTLHACCFCMGRADEHEPVEMPLPIVPGRWPYEGHGTILGEGDGGGRQTLGERIVEKAATKYGVRSLQLQTGQVECELPDLTDGPRLCRAQCCGPVLATTTSPSTCPPCGPMGRYLFGCTLISRAVCRHMRELRLASTGRRSHT